MVYHSLSISEEDGIAVLTIEREPALNALNKQIFEELRFFFAEDAPKRSIKGVIITGAGDKAFAAGADIKELLGLDTEGGQQLSKNGQDVFFLIERFSKPVIAAVNGFALGGGCELAMACHLRIASENAKFGQPEVKLGIIPGYGGTQRLVQLIGKGKALELLMTADMIDAQEAYRLGLVNYVVPMDELLSKSKNIINKIGRQGPIAVAEVIAAVNTYYEVGKDGFKYEVDSFAVISNTSDFKEGATAFVEKRKPVFKGK